MGGTAEKRIPSLVVRDMPYGGPPPGGEGKGLRSGVENRIKIASFCLVQSADDDARRTGDDDENNNIQ